MDKRKNQLYVCGTYTPSKESMQGKALLHHPNLLTGMANGTLCTTSSDY